MYNYEIPTEYREKGIKVFQELNISNMSIFFYCLSILHIPFDKYNNFGHFHLNIIAELSRGRSLLKNSTLVTLHLLNFTFNSFINK